MKAEYLVIYNGEPEDREEFLRYYREVHLPLIWAWPRIREIQLEFGIDGRDPEANSAGIFMIARFFFDTFEDLHAALQSHERVLARRDRDHFPKFVGTIRHQAVEIEEL